MLASFHHTTSGTGHVRGCLVWDARVEERVAALRLGGSTISGVAPSFSGHRATEPCVIHGDAFKVVLAVADSATVFETRTWQPLYSVRLAAGSGQFRHGCGERGGGARGYDWATAAHARGSRLAVATASGGLRFLEAEGLRPPGCDDALALEGFERSPVSHLLRLRG